MSTKELYQDRDKLENISYLNKEIISSLPEQEIYVISKEDVESVLTGTITSHSHAGSSHTQGTDQYLDQGGLSEVSAANVKQAYNHSISSHAPSGATVGADWNSNLSNIPSTFPPSTHSHGSDYEPAGAVTAHALVHAPNDAVSLTTVKADTQISDTISKAHTHQEDFTTALKGNYDSAYSHSTSSHAPSNAEQNVNADWNASSGDAQILNKPTIPTVSDTAYDSTSWDNNMDAPTKNAVRDKFESLSSGGLTQAQARRLTRR